MTKIKMSIVLSCNGRELRMGPGEDIDITKVTGLESSELDVSLQDNALVDGAIVEGKKILPRPIHIEASFRSNANNALNRARVIRFFNSKYTGTAVITYADTARQIEYELEGWSFAKFVNLDQKLGLVIDLICPDPYLLHTDDFGQNVSNLRATFAFPWRMLSAHTEDPITDYPEEARGMLLGGMPAAYYTRDYTTDLINDGDVPTGLQIRFKATRGAVSNPKILHVASGKYIRLVLDMAQGDELVIDTSERHQTITLNGVNSYQKIDRSSESFLLDVGWNTLEYDADVTPGNLDVFLYYRPKYLGV